MVNFKKIGSAIGKTVGTVTGEPIKYLGKKMNNDFVQDVGEGVKQVTSNTGKIVGGLTEGAWQTTSGLIHKDEQQRNEGLQELKGTTVQTAKGIGRGLKNTALSGKDVIEGAVTKDHEKMMTGAKALGKTAIISTVAFGIADGLDILGDDGAEAHAATGDGHMIETRNDDLAGQLHPETNVPFEAEVVTLPTGEVVEGVFPQFESTFDYQMDSALYLESDDEQFTNANMALSEQILADPQLADQFTNEQIQQIMTGETPDGYTWHHSQHPGELQLVNEDIHAQTGHTGGRELWGGGAAYR